MMKMEIEKIRLGLALEVTKTKHVMAEGLSVVEPKKLQFTIDAICEAYGITAKPDAASIYTDKYLPPLADRKL
jgi:NitT/TauT family transport system substrate-binding protein